MAVDAKVSLLHSMLDRADKLTSELKSVYDRDLAAKEVSAEALNLTHEVIEKCSNTLDQSMSMFAERYIYPLLSKVPAKERGYFPAGKDEQSYKSTLGQWGATDLQSIAPEIDGKLRQLQPFSDEANQVYANIKSFAAHKHRGLRPQIRTEQKRTHVSGPSGSVSWDPSSVTFGSGVSIMGVPMNPQTQMPAHSRGIDITVQTWVSFLIEDTGEDALRFCSSAVAASRKAIETMHPPTA